MKSSPYGQGDKMMLTASDATRLWGKLFHGQAITLRLLAEAEQLVSELGNSLRVVSRIDQK
jgi:hypothetical protein